MYIHMHMRLRHLIGFMAWGHKWGSKRMEVSQMAFTEPAAVPLTLRLRASLPRAFMLMSPGSLAMTLSYWISRHTRAMSINRFKRHAAHPV